MDSALPTINYVRQHQLIPEPKSDDPEDVRASLVVYSLINTTRHLRHLCRMKIKFACPISLEYDVVFVLYSNHTQEDEELEDKGHAEVEEILNKELECPEGPMWFEDVAWSSSTLSFQELLHVGICSTSNPGSTFMLPFLHACTSNAGLTMLCLYNPTRSGSCSSYYHESSCHCFAFVKTTRQRGFCDVDVREHHSVRVFPP
ncbi:uncharacterized protein EV420DRAFT_98980 [Desarmillaria tabescens]|uniref:Uncharacterized protein n=1 Tax=Armillaria tabescens TaxID=1929756 RepID=A0AA39NR13_ARMTA|nr:uncharacterized protein EV420DRAFT_98980 [Desarmillaria tabescens]KAK0470230.1 hypothetical protein EV420DRAFT_98980 [Desarmillaria tabescens]